MSCPSCDHTMHALGCRVTGGDFYWCPRCGTFKPCDSEATAPALVARCRELTTKSPPQSVLGQLLHALGITESVHPSADRPPQTADLLLQLFDAVVTIREEQVSADLRLGRSERENRERAAIYAAEIRRQAIKLDDLIEQIALSRKTT